MLDHAQLLYDLFQAYYDARQHKRSSKQVIQFEMNAEANIFQLHDDLVHNRYIINPSTCFIINDPVKREIFAGDFRDRIVHHLIYNYMYSICDQHFIYDSYSCRIGKGTHFGIQRLDHYIRSCSQNYTRDTYVLKMDIAGFFMNIDKDILYKQVKALLIQKQHKLTTDLDFLLNLIALVISNDPTQHCIFKGKASDYDGLPANKSLFSTGEGKGLPIGNLTSQLFANIYLDPLDKYIRYQLGCKLYGRYVDDFFIVHQDKELLKLLIPQIKAYLTDHLALQLHPKKIYLQHISKGVLFLGAYLKPHRLYIRKRTIGNFYQRIQSINKILSDFTLPISFPVKDQIQSVINSYLGICSHYSTYKIRKKLFKFLHLRFRTYFHKSTSTTKISPNIRKLKKKELYFIHDFI